MSTTALTIQTVAEAYAITVADAKAHLKITHGLEDAHIESLIASANSWAQNFTQRIFVDSKVTLKFDRFPSRGESVGFHGDVFADVYYFPSTTFGRILATNARERGLLLPGGFVSAVNDIDYTDADGAPQTLTGPTSGAPGTDYQEDLTDDEWPMVFPAREMDWPSVQSGLVNAVQLEYQVGWADETKVPEDIRHAVRFKVGDLYTIRDTADAGTKSALLRAAEDLLFPYVVQSV